MTRKGLSGLALTVKKMVDSKNGLELADLRNERLHRICLNGAELHEIDARNTSLEHVNFVSSKWEHIYFSNVHVNGIQMGGTLFENIIRPAAGQSQLSEEPGTEGWINVEPVRFRMSDLSMAVFEDCELVDVELKNCNIDGLKINGIRVKDVLEYYMAHVKEPALKVESKMRHV